MPNSSKKVKDKLGKVALEKEQISVVKMLTPFEDIIHLAGICDLNLGGRQGVGALILKKGENIQIKFCFDCLGIHPNLESSQMLPIFEGIEAGLKEIPEGENLTIHLGSFTSDYHRQEELSKLESNCQIDQLKLLIRSERLRTKKLTQSGARKNKFLRLWCTYTVIDDDERSKDFIESLIRKLEKGWFRFTGEIHAHNNTRIENILQNSFNDGFLQWSAILGNKMKLGIRVLSAEEIWSTIWQQLNYSTPPAIPNPLKIDPIDGLVETQTSDFHIRHQMLENEESVPFFDRKWVKLQNKYIGALNFSQKPGGWYDEQAQLRYLWELISRDSISDTEVICQVTKANQTISKTNLQRITKQSITSTSFSTEKGNIDVKSVLMTMVMGTSMIGVSPTITTNIESIIALALKTFFNDDEIKSRYKSAIQNGFGTQYWNETPTLKDFYNFCSPAFIQLDSIASKSQEISEALEQIRLRINYWLSTRVGQSISRPSSFRTNAKLLVFALRNLSSEADAAILALSAYSAALRRALSSKASIFFLDEAPILFQFDAIASLIGRLCANGAKSGIRVIISAQEPETIYQSASAQKIFANITTRLVGRIQSSAVDPFIVRFKYPIEIIRVNSTEAFYPKKSGIYSQWLLDDNGKLTFCRYYPAYCLLASVANNPNEQELRTLFLKYYQDNPLLGLVKFSEDYIRMIRGEELSELAKNLLSKSHTRQVA
ncbi:Type IV secretory pathway, VirB4 component (plasmid) [Nostoc flagelliforme CCNUN1]|uniref:Type IV secretory pathway, VirB4 component n=1 Tax=Nostoc flagelliforme CCNUN1 TaxID=2038116 RepID=A0A2K8T911_9NOSO|nr:hypothetical protein [Nostoc flagelliforme]AUB43555.1 Type IV secretory pathway, VirB4 component [Nostoc flagelliforme CCNUN1]